MIVRPRGQLWEYRCDNCGASWFGPEGDDCYWCDKQAIAIRESNRRRLLYPEWLYWGDRFEQCNSIDRAVWAETRGFTGDYEGKWKRDLFRAIPILLDAREVADALRRYRKWTIHIKRFDNS